MKSAYKPSVNILCILLALEDVQQNEQWDILEIIFIIWIVPGALRDVLECGHLRNHIPTGNIDVKLHVFERQVQKWYFESKDHYPDCPEYPRGCSGKRTLIKPLFYR